MAEKLSITIFLEGAAEIERQLEGIGQAGTKAFDAIGTAAEKVGGFDKLDPKDVTKKLEQFGVKGKAAIDKITAAVAQAGRLERIVGGVRAVEDGFGKIGVAASAMSTRVVNSFTAAGAAATAVAGPVSRVARSFGLIGRLGAGGLVVGLGAAALEMEKTADAARVLEANLQAIFRNAAVGTAFFNQIQNAARTAGTSLESTGKVILDIFRTLQSGLKAKGIIFAPGEGFKQTRDEAVLLFDTLQKGMKLSGARSEETEKVIAALNKELQKTGVISGDTLRKLAADFPQLANELVKFLGVPGQTMEKLADQVDRGLKKINIPKFINAVKRITPEIDKLNDAFDPTLAQRMDTISGAWNRLLDSFGKSPSGAAIKGLLDDIAKGLDEIAKGKPPTTLSGEFLNEVRKTIETTKKEWEALVSLINQTQINLGKKPPEKITVPFEADPEPAWVEAYLGFIENVRIRFKQMFSQERPDPALEPPWVQAYLGFIEQIKDKFRGMFKTEPEGPPQQPAWVETYLGWIAKVKTAFDNIFTKRPEVGGQLGGGAVPFMSGAIPPDVVAQGAARIEDRRGEGQGLDTTAINAALTELATAAQGATQSLQGLQGLDFSSIGPAVDAFNTAISSVTDSVQSLSFSDMTQAFADATAAAQQLGTDLQNLGLSEVAGAMQEVVAAANSAAQALNNIQVDGGGGGNFATGGQVFGRHGRDKIPAYLTRNEWVMRADAVKKYGVAFMRAVNEGRLRIPKFNLGGLVDGLALPMPMQIPSFADGGLVRTASGRAVNLTIMNGDSKDTFKMWADEEVAKKVVRYAVSRQVASAGRKSGAFG